MAIADMFLKLEGVTGEASDTDHKGQIDVVSWSWGMDVPTEVGTGFAKAAAKISELHIVKKVDLSSPTLMKFLRERKEVKTGQLTVRKAGKTPLEYFTIELDKVRVNSIKTESQNSELLEHLSLAFTTIRVTYVPQGPTGGPGGGSNVFETNAYLGS